MRYRALDQNGDMVMGGGRAYITDADAVRQAIATRLRLLIYEWWEDLDDGVPYWQQIIASRDKEAAEKIIKNRIQETEHVVSVLFFDADWNNESRTLDIRAGVQTEYGPVEVEMNAAQEQEVQ